MVRRSARSLVAKPREEGGMDRKKTGEAQTGSTPGSERLGATPGPCAAARAARAGPRSGTGWTRPARTAPAEACASLSPCAARPSSGSTRRAPWWFWPTRRALRPEAGQRKSEHVARERGGCRFMSPAGERADPSGRRVGCDADRTVVATGDGFRAGKTVRPSLRVEQTQGSAFIMSRIGHTPARKPGTSAVRQPDLPGEAVLSRAHAD